MKGVDMFMIMFVTVLVGFILLVFQGDIVLGTGEKIGTLYTQSLLLQTNLPNNLVKTAVLGDEETKDLAKILVDKRTPYDLAVSPETYQVTEEGLDRFDKFLRTRATGTQIYTDIAAKCQTWLTSASPGDVDFVLNDKIINKYYEGVTSDSGFTTLNAAYISKLMFDSLDAINEHCGQAGCPNARNCANCWLLIEGIQELQMTGDFSGVRSLLNDMTEIGCSMSCAQVCSAVYPRIKMTTAQDNEVRKDFISLGIQLN